MIYPQATYLHAFSCREHRIVMQKSTTPVRDIQVEVARHFGIPLRLMTERDMVQPAPLARQVAMFLAHSRLNIGSSDIGRRFKRDHSTVCHGIRRVEHRLAHDAAFRFEMDRLLHAVRG